MAIALTTMLGLGGVGLATAVSASAHTPNVSADCKSLTISLTSYGANDTNTVDVAIDGVELAGYPLEFDTAYSATIDLDPAKAQAYKVKVRSSADPEGTKGWSKNFSGTSPACELPPVVTPHHTEVVNCDTLTVTIEDWTTTTPPGTDSEHVVTHRDATLQECPNGELPANQVEHRDVVGSPDCKALTVTTSHQSRSRAAHFEGRELVWGEWSEWVTDSSDKRDASVKECANPPVPAAKVQHRDATSKPDCAAREVTTTTSERTRSAAYEGRKLVWGPWSRWTVVASSVRQATNEECPVVAPPVQQAAPRTELAYTGSPTGTIVLVGLALIALGTTALVATRRKGVRA